MSIVSMLSSQVGEKTEEGNRKVAMECIKNPKLLDEIKEGLTSKDKVLIDDCLEVFTKAAEEITLCKQYVTMEKLWSSRKRLHVRY